MLLSKCVSPLVFVNTFALSNAHRMMASLVVLVASAAAVHCRDNLSLDQEALVAFQVPVACLHSTVNEG